MFWHFWVYICSDQCWERCPVYHCRFRRAFLQCRSLKPDLLVYKYIHLTSVSNTETPLTCHDQHAHQCSEMTMQLLKNCYLCRTKCFKLNKKNCAFPWHDTCLYWNLLPLWSLSQYVLLSKAQTQILDSYWIAYVDNFPRETKINENTSVSVDNWSIQIKDMTRDTTP